MVKDAVCGMTIDENRANSTTYQGKTYYFCSEGCKAKFLENPTRYAEGAGPR